MKTSHLEGKNEKSCRKVCFRISCSIRSFNTICAFQRIGYTEDQITVLIGYFDKGMTSRGKICQEMHESASKETGLEIDTIKVKICTS